MKDANFVVQLPQGLPLLTAKARAIANRRHGTRWLERKLGNLDKLKCLK